MMFRVLMLLLLTLPAAAQTIPANTDTSKAVEPLAQQHTHADTVRALHNLFKSRRNTGGWLVGGSAFFTTLTGVGTLLDNNGKGCGGYFCPDAAGSALLIGIGTAPVWIPYSVSLIRFNKNKERAAVAQYEQTRKLPPTCDGG